MMVFPFLKKQRRVSPGLGRPRRALTVYEKPFYTGRGPSQWFFMASVNFPTVATCEGILDESLLFIE
jgi:hypothetical protein